MAPHSSTLAWKIPWAEEPGRLQSTGWPRVGLTQRLHFHFSLSCFGEGNGNPLQCSCLENPRDGGAVWAAVYRVAQSRTRLKRLSSSSSSKIQKMESHKFLGTEPYLNLSQSSCMVIWNKYFYPFIQHTFYEDLLQSICQMLWCARIILAQVDL